MRLRKKNVSLPYLKPQMSTEFSPVNDNEDPSLRLSKREIEVLRLICQERTNQEMAAALFVSVKTIEGHRERIRYKTNTKNIAGMVLYAIKHGIFEVWFTTYTFKTFPFQLRALPVRTIWYIPTGCKLRSKSKPSKSETFSCL